MYSELSSARARTHRAERMKDGTIGAATVGRERGSVGKEPSRQSRRRIGTVSSPQDEFVTIQVWRDAFSIDCVHLQREAALDD